VSQKTREQERERKAKVVIKDERMDKSMIKFIL
jgi:hypothetical protein